MALINSYIKDVDLQSEFLKAKILANPFDYKISSRVFFIDNRSESTKYNIFLKANGTECKLADLLELDYDDTYFKFNPGFAVAFDEKEYSDIIDNDKSDIDNFLSMGGFSFLYNNLIIRDDLLSELILPKNYSNFIKLKNDKIIEGIEFWNLKFTSNESLIPNLFYLSTEYKNRTLNELEDLVPAKEFMNCGKAPLVPTFYNCDNAAVLYTTPIIPGWLYGMSGVSPKTKTFEHIESLNISLTISYLMELMYTLKDAIVKYPNLIDYLNYKKTAKFCSYFYSIEGDNLIINPNLEACFDEDNETRFNNFKRYYETVFMYASKINIYSAEFEMPMLLNYMVSSAYQYAYQQCRVKHLILLYTECKNKGIDLSEAFTESLDSDNMSLPGGGGLGASSEDPSNELIDLSMVSYNGDIPKPESDDILNSTRSKENPPTLDTVDMLKHDLHNSPYTFDVNIIKSKTEQQDNYNKVANSVKMLTTNLSKQIKEIKVYNTGGKNGGQSSGKLDKKNLWKYRTDHNIFYNNNYKIKEMDLAFGCILDESGSMYGEKIKNGRVVMILLHEVLSSLGINHSIIGHTSHGEHNCIVNKYYQFKEELGYTLQKPYALSSINDKSGNCDSGALYYMQSVMKQVRNKDKIVIIFSDGEPTECSEVELKQQVQTMEKEGIHVIGVGINFESIKEYYPDNANGKNLKEMLDIVVSILKRYVLEKKD